jgi:hypothetical protein
MENYPKQPAPAMPGFEDHEPAPFHPNIEALTACIMVEGYSTPAAKKLAKLIHSAGWGAKCMPTPPVSARDSAVGAIKHLRQMMDADKALCLLDAAGKELTYFKMVRRETVNVTEFKS